MKSTILKDWNSIKALKSEWAPLLELADTHKLFLSWEWLESWIYTVKEKLTPFFIAVRDNDDKLVGVAPLYFAEMRLLGHISFRTLRPASDHSTGFEYTDFIVHPNHEDTALRSIGKALRASESEWDLIWLPKIAGWNNANQRILQAIATHGKFKYNIRDTVFSSIRLPDTIEGYDATFSSKRRNQHKRITKHIFTDNTARFIQCETQDELDHFLDVLFDLHHKRRMLYNDPGTFIRRPSQPLFYRSFTPKALKKGWLRISALEARGTIQAIQLGYVCNGTYLQLQEGFNPDFIAGVGNVLRHHVIAQCINDGLVEYDFLGGFSEHKRRWGAKTRNGYDIIVGNHSLKSRLLIKLQIWPTGRYLQQYGLAD
jgi:CelD/BcsL family acetyltransferase involved in cellulose biosynthesis